MAIPKSKGSPSGGQAVSFNAWDHIEQFPHCDQRVLHAPGECHYCDGHPDWQALRISWGISFTGHDDGDLVCPATIRRDVDTINRWGGNRPSSGLDIFDTYA